MKHISVKMNPVLDRAVQHWKYVAPILAYPKNASDYDELVEHMDQLLDIVGEDENHPLIGLVDAVSNLISSYDEKNYQVPNAIPE